jgi:hypothetical protein
LKEVRAYHEEDNKDVLVVQRNKTKEILSAWKIRYYVELCRLNTMRRIVDKVEIMNIQLERDREQLRADNQASLIKTEKQAMLIESLMKDVESLTETEKRLLNEVNMAVEASEQLQKSLSVKSSAFAAALEELARLEEFGQNSKQNIERLNSELDITRRTCQDLVKGNSLRDNELADLRAALHREQTTREQYEKQQHVLFEQNREEVIMGHTT